MSNKKLTQQDKLDIVQSPQSGRSLAEKYGVHQSTVSEIRREARELLLGHWDKKSASVGRPAKNEEPEKISKEEYDLLIKEKRIAEMQRDWARLNQEQAEKRLANLEAESRKGKLKPENPSTKKKKKRSKKIRRK